MRTSPWLVALYSIIIFVGMLVALPNVLSPAVLDKFPSFMPTERVPLGLDLRGGAHLVLEVDAADLVKERLQTILTDSRNSLREAGIQTTSVRRVRDAIVIVLTDPTKRADAITELAKLGNSVGVGGAQSDLAVTPTADDTITVALTPTGLAQRTSAAVEQSVEIIRQRVDQVGVSEPTIQRIGGNRVLVQLPGNLAVNDSTAYMNAGLAGLGIIQMASYSMQPHLDEGRLELLLQDWTSSPLPVHVVYPQNRHLSAKVRVFVEWVADLFLSHPGFQLKAPVRKAA